MKGKRDKRKAQRAWAHAYMWDDTAPSECGCGHAGMPAVWHRNTCAVHIGARATKP